MNILNRLTIKHLTMNKRRTIVSVVGIILSTALMVGIGLLLSTFREVMIKDVEKYNGTHHAVIDKVDINDVSIISNNSNVTNIKYKKYMGYSKYNNDLEGYNTYMKLFEADNNYLKSLKLTKGRYPNNGNEIIIPVNISNYNNMHDIGDEIELNLGDRYLNDQLLTGEFKLNEYIKVVNTKKYVIVGVYNEDVLEDYFDVGDGVFTRLDNSNLNKLTVYIEYNNPKKAYKITNSIASTLGFTKSNDSYKEISYNDNLLSLYGESKYTNLMDGMTGILAIMLSLVSIACIIVIYNSFAISVMERKKQFGLFSSIGATRKQIKKTVIFEAFILSIIAIPLGIISAYIGIGIVIHIMNNLVGGYISDSPLVLCTYQTFIVVPIIFMLFTIFISALIPARRASKISPIEAIRLNDDIKIKGKKIKSPKIVLKLFKIEGDIAYKNMKRNKKKYRVTVASLFISIVLFISFSGFLDYMLASTDVYINTPNYDLELVYSDNVDKKVIESIKSNKDIDSFINYKILNLETTTDLNDAYTKRYSNFIKENLDGSINNEVNIIALSNKDYNNYLKKIGQIEKKPIIYNKANLIRYSSNSRKAYVFNRFDTNKLSEINIVESLYDEENQATMYKNVVKFDDFYITNEEFMSLELYSFNYPTVIIISEDMLNKFYNYDLYNYMIIKSDNYEELDKVLKDYNEILDPNLDQTFYYNNIALEIKLISNLVLALKILIYGFITLVTLIGVTSVFNTISTSIMLRRKEFAVLRSIGLTPKGFNKMLYFESILFGLKALLYALPVSFIVLYLISISMGNLVEFESMLIPYDNIIIAIFGVFIIVGLSMIHSTRKIKKENILDAIREENI